MPKTHRIIESQVAEIIAARKENKDKQVEKRLYAVQMRGEGKRNAEIAEQQGTSSDMISYWVSCYAKRGLAGLLPAKREAHRRNMSTVEEQQLLSTFEKEARAGQVVEVSDIKKAYETKVAHTIGSGQIYKVLKRHGWRKIKPRSRHPKKATPEAIEASKKLTQR